VGVTTVVCWGIGLLVALVAIHLALVWLESRNWVYYRRRPRHGGPQYHLLHMSSVFDPQFRQVMEIMVEDARQRDDSGDPPARTREGEAEASGDD
jgi:hypothetical protein